MPLSIVWTLGGDAGQRVLFAWAMGWSPALEVSQQGRGWLTPFLAQLLVDRYGDEAGIEAAKRADDMLDKGDLDGKAVWLRIMRAVEELLREEPREGERVN